MAFSRGGDLKSEWRESTEQLDLGLTPIMTGCDWLGLADVITWVRSEAALYRLSVSPAQAPSLAASPNDWSLLPVAQPDPSALLPPDRFSLKPNSENGLKIR